MRSMDDILSFVEDAERLKDKLKRFVDIIQQVLITIEECCTWIGKYLETNVAGTIGSLEFGYDLNHQFQVRRGKHTLMRVGSVIIRMSWMSCHPGSAELQSHI